MRSIRNSGRGISAGSLQFEEVRVRPHRRGGADEGGVVGRRLAIWQDRRVLKARSDAVASLERPLVGERDEVWEVGARKTSTWDAGSRDARARFPARPPTPRGAAWHQPPDLAPDPGSDSTIADLHATLQLALVWSDDHLHRFVIHSREYGISYAGRPQLLRRPR